MSARRIASIVIVLLFPMALAFFAQAQWREFVSEEDFCMAGYTRRFSPSRQYER